MECKDEMIRSLQLSYSLSINLAIVESCTFVVPSYMAPDKKRDKTQSHVLLSSSLGHRWRCRQRQPSVVVRKAGGI